MNHEQTNWMYPGQIYVVSGSASANSLFLEDKRCHEIFFEYLNRFVTPMVNILHYKLTSTGWAMLIHTKSKKEISEAYTLQRKKSIKADREKDHKEEKRMLSEHFRMFLSNFARQCNAHLHRHGVWVLKKFDKVQIANEKDYNQEFEKICDLQSCNYHQLKKKYQPDKEMYDVQKELVDLEGTPHVLRSSAGVYNGKMKIENVPISLVLIRPKSDVLRKFLNMTNSNQKPKTSTPQLE